MPSPDKLSADAIQTLVHVGELRDHIEDLHDQLREHVSYAREQGASWRMIGVSLGTSAQSAWERYSGRERDSEVPQQEALLSHEDVQNQSWVDIRPDAITDSQVDEAVELINRRADF